MSGGRCARPHCGEFTPMDMAGIVFGDDTSATYCSPECAREKIAFTAPGEYPMRITFLDPQNAVDRDDLPGVDRDDASMTTKADSTEEAYDVIDDIEAMFPGEFRPSGEENDE